MYRQCLNINTMNRSNTVILVTDISLSYNDIPIDRTRKKICSTSRPICVLFNTIKYKFQLILCGSRLAVRFQIILLILTYLDVFPFTWLYLILLRIHYIIYKVLQYCNHDGEQTFYTEKAKYVMIKN